MATRSSVLAWRIPGTGEPCGLPSTGSHRVGHDWSDLAAAGLLIICTSTPLFLKPLHRFCYQKWIFPAAKLHWERTSIIGSVLLIRKLESRELWWFKQDNTANKVQGLNLKGKSQNVFKSNALSPAPSGLWPKEIKSPIRTVIYTQIKAGDARVCGTALRLN